jgi:hypothetical protein
VVRLLGHSGPDVLASLAAAPAILTADLTGWRLARSAEMITLDEVRERAGVAATGSAEPLTLAALAKQVNGAELPAAAPGPGDSGRP